MEFKGSFTHDRFALKRINLIGLSKEMHEHVITESMILARLHHQNIVKLYEIYESSTSLYLVMELLRGGELFDRLAQSGAELLTETLVRLDEITPRPQNDAESCYAHMLDKKMAVIDWSKSARELDCLVRGLNPWPIALTSLAGERLKVYAAEPADGCGEPGTVLEADPKKGLTVACGEGVLTLTEIQLVGGRRMKATDFLRGHAVEKGSRLGE